MLSLTSAVLAATLFAGASHAQIVDRPPLPRGADVNDWEAYYDAGVAMLPKNAEAAEALFTWSSRLRPDRADPLYARWIAYWANHLDQFADYLRDDARTLRDPKVIRADSLRSAALRRNPFVHQGLVVFLYDRLPGRWQQDQLTLGWLSLGQADLPRALDRFGRLVKADPKKYGYLRFVRASAFANTSAFDSAGAELTTLLAQLRAEDEKTLGRGYQSKELLEHALGMLNLSVRRGAAAKEAFGRAVAENAGFAPAHAMLGVIAIAARDTTTALAEYSLAVETEAGDPELRLGYGNALMLAKRPKDAAIHFKKATELEPMYAEPYYLLAQALDASGDRAAAKEQYQLFLEHASQADPRRPDAERRRSAP